MKFERLELSAFGHFKGQALDFSVPSAGLHLIYGNNEAGKSTALRAIRGLLFGVPVQSQDTFVHTGKDIRVGAVLVNAEQRLEVVRRKGRKHTLLNAQGEALDDDALRPWLGGVDETLFNAMFGLDHTGLRAGAESLLALGGKPGATLYGASLGTAHLRTTLPTDRFEPSVL